MSSGRIENCQTRHQAKLLEESAAWKRFVDAQALKSMLALVVYGNSFSTVCGSCKSHSTSVVSREECDSCWRIRCVTG